MKILQTYYNSIRIRKIEHNEHVKLLKLILVGRLSIIVINVSLTTIIYSKMMDKNMLKIIFLHRNFFLSYSLSVMII